MAKKHSGLFEQVRQAYDRSQILIDDNAARYQDSWLYYRCLKPYNLAVAIDEQGRPVDKNGEHEQSTEYVAPVLRTAVQQLAPAITATFCESDQQAVFFRDYSFKTDPKLEQIINEQVNQILLQLNDGHALIDAAVKDTLITGDSFGKVMIEPNITKDKITLEDFTDLEQILSQLSGAGWEADLPDGFPAEAKGKDGDLEWKTVNADVPDPNTGASLGQQMTILIKGTLGITRNDKKVVIEVVGFKDLVIDTACGSEWKNLRYICQKHHTTVGDAIKMGFRKKDLENASTLSALTDTPYNKRVLVSNAQVSTDEDWHAQEGADPLERPIRLYEHYIHSSLPSGKTKIYQVWSTDVEMLDYSEVSFIPFVHGQMAPISDSFYSESLYDFCWRYQDMESDLQRVAKQNVIDSTFQKTIAVAGKYDRASLINSHQTGAIIEVNDNPGYVQPYPHVDLPQSYSILAQQISDSKQQTVGALVGNINTEEGVPANIAASTVSMLLGQEGLKTKAIARAFARSFVAPLYQMVYRTLVEEGITIKMEDGTQISSKDFPSAYEFVVDINTAGDTTAKNAQLAAVLNMVSSVPTGSMATASTVFKVADEMLMQVGLKAKDFFQDPATQQPDPEQQQMQAAQKEAALLNVQKVAAEVSKLTAETALVEEQMKQLGADSAIDREIKLTESTLKNQEMQHQQLLNAAKVASDNKAKAASTVIDAGKLALDQKAVDAEIAHGAADITIKHIQASNKFNGIQE